MLEQGKDFYFITRYPLASKPFYTMPEGEKHSRGFDLECKGVEVSSGSQRIHNIDLLIERLRACNLDPKDFEAYISAFRYGMPPHGGWGFGLDRFVWYLAGLPNVREARLFPRDRYRFLEPRHRST